MRGVKRMTQVQRFETAAAIGILEADQGQVRGLPSSTEGPAESDH